MDVVRIAGGHASLGYLESIPEAMGLTYVGYDGGLDSVANIPSIHGHCRLAGCKTLWRRPLKLLFGKGNRYVRWRVLRANLSAETIVRLP